MLCNHSFYSLRYGTVSPKDLISLAEENGYSQIALTDINCTAGILEFFRLAAKKNIHPVAGIDFRNGIQPMYIGLATNEAGFFELNEHLSHHLHTQQPFLESAPTFQHAIIIYPYQSHRDYSNLKANEYVGISPKNLTRWSWEKPGIAQEKLVALHTFTFRHKRDYNTHRLLRAIACNTLLSKLPTYEQALASDQWHSYQALENIYAEYPFLLQNAAQLLASCQLTFSWDGKTSLNQQCYGESHEADKQLLRQLCDQGIAYRYPQVTPQVLHRLESELQVIEQQGFISYFLINWDIVSYARSKGYFYVGRGSGANSLVAYLIQITDVDPIELDLYFERFINIFRKTPPDFDIDFSWRDREDITQYIFQRFKHVALLGAFNTFQYAATVRELGKVFGLPKEEIDALSETKTPFNQLDSLQQMVLQYAQYLQDFPNYISIHASGILITEKPIHTYGATFLPPKGFATTQFDMHQAEDISINKLDILSQRGLEKIKETLTIIRQNRGIDIDIHDLPRFKNDPQCNRLLTTSGTIGCFYIESPAMRILLTKLQTHDYIGLVAASSVIRPGVASSGMMSAYIQREREPLRRSDAPKPLLELMPETYGVMVYQEDVIKVAHVFAGLSLSEADVLRRGMSGKYRSREEFQLAKEKFIQGALSKGHSKSLVLDVWRQVESFAGYAFAKGHSASYAVESYQCLFLKCYYPLEYMTATINNEGGYYHTEFYIHEARMRGAIIHAPCINQSEFEAIIKGPNIILGLNRIKDLDHNIQQAILDARLHGPFLSLDDLLARVPITLESGILLARVGALRFTGLSKKELLWQLHVRLTKHTQPTTHLSLFPISTKKINLPPLEMNPLEDAYDELELLGFPLCSPFDLMDETIESAVLAKDLASHLYLKTHQTITVIGYKITTKTVTTSRGERMKFGNFLDQEGQFIDTVHFPVVASKYPFSGWGIFIIQGKVINDYGAISIDVTHIRKARLKPDPRRV